MGIGTPIRTAWLDSFGQWWVDGRVDTTFQPTPAFVGSLDHWINQQSLQWHHTKVPNLQSNRLPESLPNGGWVLYSAYEAFQVLEPALAHHAKPDPDEWPLFLLVAFPTYHWIDPASGDRTTWHHGASTPPSPPCGSVGKCHPVSTTDPSTHLSHPPTSQSLDRSAFEAAVADVLEAIEQGELYQANVSIRLETEVQLEPLTLLAQLLTVNPSPFSGALKTPWGWLISNSPERLVSVDNSAQVSARPIAGTRPRSGDPETNHALLSDLQAHPKDRAEHLMLVDLARNDLGKVCQPGSVIVDELLVVEEYSHVTHLVSNVIGQRQPKTSALAVWAATFPGGTITGCPKIRCIATLNRLEPVARTFYTGALGWLDANNQTLDTNILIRSVRLLPTGKTAINSTPHWRAQFHAGAGVVADSQPNAEYDESLRKAAVMALTLAGLSQPSLGKTSLPVV
jgi:anthranilate/para-aminobenzoate synthase component I